MHFLLSSGTACVTRKAPTQFAIGNAGGGFVPGCPEHASLILSNVFTLFLHRASARSFASFLAALAKLSGSSLPLHATHVLLVQ